MTKKKQKPVIPPGRLIAGGIRRFIQSGRELCAAPPAARAKPKPPPAGAK